MRKIILTQGMVALVDDLDFEALSQYLWCAHFERGRWYALRNLPDGKQIRMHNTILKVEPVDHKDGNGLNNQRYNLRPATYSGNAANQKLQKRSKTGYKGVRRSGNKYVAYINSASSGYTHLGIFSSIEDAAQAYDAAAIRLHGEFARTNASLGLLGKER